MKLSVIICTFNRALQLEQLLDDLAYQYSKLSSEDQAQAELLIIDNNSNDNTKEIAYKFSESNSFPAKYYFESRQGIGFARNLGIKNAKGDLVSFLDDDVTLDDDWLKEVFKLANNCKNQEVGVFGGRVVPLWQERTPSWLNIEPPYAVDQNVFCAHSMGDEEAYYPIADKDRKYQHPIGTNMMFRRDVFDYCGDFRTDLGVNASGGFGLHEDVEFLRYLSTVKVPMLYAPQCIIFHPILPSQMTQRNIRRWYFKSGQSTYWMSHTDRMRRKPDPLMALPKSFRPLIPSFLRKATISNVPVYLHIKLIACMFLWLFFFLAFSRKKVFWASLQVSKTLGEMEGATKVYEHFKNKNFSFEDLVLPTLEKKSELDSVEAG